MLVPVLEEEAGRHRQVADARPRHEPWSQHARPAAFQISLFAAAFLLLAGLVVVERGMLAESIRMISRMSFRWFGPAVAAEAVSLMAFAAVHRRLLAVGHTSLSLADATAITLASNAISSSVPVVGSEIGTAYSFHQFQLRHATGVTAAWALVISGAASSVTFSAIVSVAAIESGDGWAVVGGVVGSALLLGAILLGVIALRRPAVRLRLEAGAVRILSAGRRVARRPAGDSALLVRQALERVSALRLMGRDGLWVLAWSATNWLADAACLGVALHATGISLPWPDLLLAWTAGATASSFQVTPGGLGVVEAALIGALVVAGVPANSATAAALSYRLISYWLVVFVGWLVLLARRGGPTGQRWMPARPDPAE